MNEGRRVGIQFDYVVKDGIKFYPLYSGRQWYVSECGKVLGAKGVILTPVDNGAGYKLVKFQDGRGTRNKYIHRLVAEVFLYGSNRLYVNHKDGNKANNHRDNIEYVTAKQNTAHAIETGLTKNLPSIGQQGFQHGNS